MSSAGGRQSWTPPYDCTLLAINGTQACMLSNRDDLSWNDWALGGGLAEGAYEGAYGVLAFNTASSSGWDNSGQVQLGVQLRKGDPVVLAFAARGLLMLILDVPDDVSAEIPA